MFAMMDPNNTFDPSVNWEDLLPIWGTTFHAIPGVARRKALPHRDPGTSTQWFDLLVSGGEYGDVWLSLPSLVWFSLSPPARYAHLVVASSGTQ